MKSPIRLNKKVALMAYVDLNQHTRLKAYCEKHNIGMSQIVREGVEIRLSSSKAYDTGWNEAITRAQRMIMGHSATQMRYPNNRSIADLLFDELECLKQGDVDEHVRA
jgi:hypothetical protein